MRKIEKSSAPVELINFLKKNPTAKYDDDIGELRVIIRGCLLEEQKYLCGYCCRQIDSNNTTNEHIKPRYKYPKDSLNYQNIIASCQEQTSCDKHKENTYDEALFVSPLESDCTSHFRFHPNGEIEGLDEKGKYTVTLLNLNSRSLRDARGNLIKQLQYMPEDYIKYLLTENPNQLPAFADMLEYFLSICYFK